MASSVLQQTLRGLCSDSEWCYAVFWRLKRQLRSVLTWEDGFYEQSKFFANSRANSVSTATSSFVTSSLLGQQTTREGNFEDPVGQAFAKMSYHVYSVGEGIIGRVAFTNKHQWVFSPIDKVVTTAALTATSRNNRCQPEKYPAGWQVQFAAGIKTIAVIAVPEGVIQLGSMQMITEDLSQVGHVKAVFATLQNVPGAYLSDLVSESQRGLVQGVYPLAVPVTPSTSRVPLSNSTTVAGLMMTSVVPPVLNSNPIAGLFPTGGNNFGLDGVGSLPMLLTSQQLHSQQQLAPAAVPGIQGSAIASQCLGSNSLFHPSFAVLKPMSTGAGPKEAAPLKSNAPPRCGIIDQFELTIKGRSRILPFAAETLTKDSIPNIPVTTTGKPHLVRHNSSIAGSAARSVDSAKDGPSQATVQNQSGGSFCFVQDDRAEHELSKRDSLVLDSGASTLSWESLRTSGMSGLGNSLQIKSYSSDESQGQSQVCESQRVDTDSGIWASHLSENPSRCINTTSGLDGAFDLQMSDVLQFTEPFKNADKFDYEDHMLLDMFNLDPKDRSSLLSDDSIDDMPQLQFRKSEALCGNLSCQNSFSSELEDFDDFIASLAQEQTKQSVCFSSLGADFAAGDEVSEASFHALNDLLQKGSVQDIVPKTSLEVSGTEAVEVSLRKDGYKAYRNVNARVGNVSENKKMEAKPEHILDGFLTGVSSIKRIPQDCDGFPSCKTGLHFLPSSLPELMNRPHGRKPADRTPPNGHLIMRSPALLSSEGHEEAKLLSNVDNSSELQSRKMEVVESVSCAGFKMLEENDAEILCPKSGPLPGFEQDNIVKAGKKRARPGDTGRPRPKDRQMIQDRVRDLRDIIPNATKCSIDALLERTIKYVNFLQTVTQNADKWQHSSKLEADCSTCIEPGPDSTECGTSWAMELGGQEISCPIIVEDLRQPRQMLVEMVCEENGIFLEIAESIRILGLTILKGVMEARNDKLWARFVVEAVRDVHRLEVLWSLMQLLQPNSKPSSKSTSLPCA